MPTNFLIQSWSCLPAIISFIVWAVNSLNCKIWWKNNKIFIQLRKKFYLIKWEDNDHEEAHDREAQYLHDCHPHHKAYSCVIAEQDGEQDKAPDEGNYGGQGPQDQQDPDLLHCPQD